MTVRSMRGQQIDMVKLISENSQKVAIGNAGLNARGDKVTSQGMIIATREQVMTEYNSTNPKAVKQMGLSSLEHEVMTPSETVAHIRRKELNVVAETDKAKRKISDQPT